MEEGEGGGVAATPGNTMGMVNPTPPGEGGEPGSEPMVTAKTKIHIKNKKKKRTLVESLLDDEEDLVNNEDTIIEQFLKDNYNIRGTYTIKNGVVDVDGDVILKNTNLEFLTNGLFEFGEVTGLFNAGGVTSTKIKSLKGAPKIAGRFSVLRSKITSLKGGPEIVNNDYNIYYNDKLLSLKGAPKIVKGDYICYHCDSLKSLKGAPKTIGGTFDCSECYELISLEGGPEIVGGDYNCYHCVNLLSLKGVAKVIKNELTTYDCSKLNKEESEKIVKTIKVKQWLKD